MAPSNVYFENSTEIYMLNKLIIINGYFYIYAAFIKEDWATHTRTEVIFLRDDI